MKNIRMKTRNFILSDHFPIFLAICLFFSSLLDNGITNYIIQINPELFHSEEEGLLGKHFLDTSYWWVASLGYASIISIILLIAYTNNLKSNWWKTFFKDNSMIKDEIQWVLVIRLICLSASISGFLAVFLWTFHI